MSALRERATLAMIFIFFASAVEAETPGPMPAWMAGHWCVDIGEEKVEELWLPPHGNVMPGPGRTLNARPGLNICVSSIPTVFNVS